VIAVGTAVSGGPSHRSRRAELPHRAPVLGHDGQALGGMPYPGSLPAVFASTPLARVPGPVSGPRSLEANCPGPAPFPRPAPPTHHAGDFRQAALRRLCSRGSSVLWGRQTSHARSSPSCSGPVRGATALPYGSLIHYSPPATGASPQNSEMRRRPRRHLAPSSGSALRRIGPIMLLLSSHRHGAIRACEQNWWRPLN